MDKYRKFIVAAAAAGLLAAQQVLPLTETQRGWVTIALAVLGAIGVWAVPNAPAEPKQAAGVLTDTKQAGRDRV